ncbi:capsular polysaccharide biosynthesis protein [Pelagibaculum spongiae]|uniref:capsular polysaccharide biosynthesis protein n=1 Tax=Pelagibaculum spongiae TaxID=2080658 RepID=UPI001313DF00|nr:capsular polysaccharide biosynthesis protein [Pelagibaculum spongiae]
MPKISLPDDLIWHTSSRKLSRQLSLQGIFQKKIQTLPRFSAVLRNKNAAIVGWGSKPNTHSGKQFAQRNNLPFYSIEDGFFGWLGHPAAKGVRLSAVFDSSGIYYDASKPSDLELLLNSPESWLDFQLLSRAEKLIDRITSYHISKYNHDVAIGHGCGLKQSFVLVIDQTYADMSVSGALANQADFDLMLKAALEENPKDQVVVRAHPDVLLGKKQGWLISAAGVKSETLRKKYADEIKNGRLIFSTEAINPGILLDQADKVYTVSSQMGFEALLYGTPTICFGVPFYSGWGLTDDRKPCRRRIQKHTVASLFAAACLRYSRYWNPETGQQCEMEQALQLIVNQKTQRGRSLKFSKIIACKCSIWRKQFLPNFVSAYAPKISFSKKFQTPVKSEALEQALLVWGRRHAADYQPEPGQPRLLRMEDGFIRSVGLGSDFKRPWSLVVDSRGIYFDPTRPSDLEHYLQNHLFSSEEEVRSGKLIEKLRATKISKYNDADDGGKLDKAGNDLFISKHSLPPWRSRSAIRHTEKYSTPVSDHSPDGARCLSSLPLKILVPGQVEDDASIQYGCIDIKTNLDLLKQVRRDNPKAWIIYKPHPDVLAGNRLGKIALQQASEYAGQIVTDAGIYDVIDAVDQVHTMTSLAGFEALLAGKQVHCYGIPFYANWGLTVDRHHCDRRNRNLNLNQLVFATLCLYPTYIHWNHGFYTTPEAVIDALEIEKRSVKKMTRSVPQKMNRYRLKLKYLLEIF